MYMSAYWHCSCVTVLFLIWLDWNDEVDESQPDSRVEATTVMMTKKTAAMSGEMPFELDAFRSMILSGLPCYIIFSYLDSLSKRFHLPCRYPKASDRAFHRAYFSAAYFRCILRCDAF